MTLHDQILEIQAFIGESYDSGLPSMYWPEVMHSILIVLLTLLARVEECERQHTLLPKQPMVTPGTFFFNDHRQQL